MARLLNIHEIFSKFQLPKIGSSITKEKFMKVTFFLF